MGNAKIPQCGCFYGWVAQPLRKDICILCAIVIVKTVKSGEFIGMVMMLELCNCVYLNQLSVFARVLSASELHIWNEATLICFMPQSQCVVLCSSLWAFSDLLTHIMSIGFKGPRLSLGDVIELSKSMNNHHRNSSIFNGGLDWQLYTSAECRVREREKKNRRMVYGQSSASY